MNARTFIDRPVTAAVLSIMIVLAGLASLRSLPVRQYPNVVPPQVSVQAQYPGADAETVAQSVAVPLEAAINGTDGMIYMQSANADGNTQIIVFFEVGTDPDLAAIDVSNRIQSVLSSLPADAQRLGVQVQKQTNALVTILSLTSTRPGYDDVAISNYALRSVIDEIKRVPGIGDAQLFSQKNYAMRVWVRPDQLAAYSLTTADVARAIQEQNQQFPAGTVGAAPGDGGAFTYTMTTRGRLPDAAAFGDIVLRANPDGASLRLRDVARVELGSEHYDFLALENGVPAVPIGIFLRPGANALDAVAAVRARVGELARQFPDGIGYTFAYDTTRFVRASIREVLLTFGLALTLVAVVTYVFLGSVRATLIPLAAVPVSIIGTFAGLFALGFSVNLFTLFGLILAIGIVVDDAIVVMENTERIMRVERLAAREAAARAITEVAGPVVAIVLVLCAVFAPVAFLGGLTGSLYRQFAATIVISVVISGVVALTLTPALCALVLRPHGHRRFDDGFDRFARWTAGVAGWVLRHRAAGVCAFAAICAGAAALFLRVPAGLVPAEDQGQVIVGWTLAPGASLARNNAVMARADRTIRALPGVANDTAFSGWDLLSNANKTYAGTAFVGLKDWSARTTAALDARAMPPAITAALDGEREAQFVAFAPPAIDGLGQVGGFEVHVLDHEARGPAALMAATEALVHEASQSPALADLTSTLHADTPRLRADVDRAQAKALGVAVDDVFAAIQATFGSFYVNDFSLYGRNYHVNIQSDAAYRQDPGDLSRVFVRAASGAMVPLSSVVRLTRIVGADALERFNNSPSAQVTGGAAAGFSSGEAIAAIEAAARSLPPGYAIAWAGAAYEEIASGGRGLAAAAGGVLVVYLILAALYERWLLPLAVVAVVPLALAGAVLAVWLRGLENDVYFQVGVITLVGLSAKNAVLIVEFAHRRRRGGLDPAEAALSALRVRLRPIVMTSLAFILGCLPLALSTGAGSAARHAVGTGVIGGMLGATVLAVLFVPLAFRLVSRAAQPARVPISAGGA